MGLEALTLQRFFTAVNYGIMAKKLEPKAYFCLPASKAGHTIVDQNTLHLFAVKLEAGLYGSLLHAQKCEKKI